MNKKTNDNPIYNANNIEEILNRRRVIIVTISHDFVGTQVDLWSRFWTTLFLVPGHVTGTGNRVVQKRLYKPTYAYFQEIQCAVFIRRP